MLITVHDIIEKCKFYTENENVDFATKEDEDGIMIKFFDNDNHILHILFFVLEHQLYLYLLPYLYLHLKVIRFLFFLIILLFHYH